MKKLILSFLLCLQVGFCSEASLKKTDINKVMDQFFSIHVEQDRMNEQIIKRAFRVYIERFDGEKLYLLQREVTPYLNMSDSEARRIMARYNNKDFSDFEKLNKTIQNAIVRHRFIRQQIQRDLLSKEIVGINSPTSYSSYSTDEKELYNRVNNRVAAFLEAIDKKWDLSSLNRKEKAFSLFEKRISRSEGHYLFKDSRGVEFSPSQKEHYLTLHILKAFSKSLDTHTAFFSDEEAYQMRTSLQKKFEGVGVVLTEGIDGVVISDIIKGGPADLSGKIEVDDLLVEVNGKSLNTLAFEEVMDLLKKSSMEIQLGLVRKNKDKNTAFYRVVL